MASSDVSQVAIERLTDQTLLARVASKASYTHVRDSAKKRLKELYGELEAVKPAAEEVKQALITAAAEVDLTSSMDKLKEHAKQMSVDALKATAEKYKAQFLSTKNSLETKADLLSKIPWTELLSTEAQSLKKDIQTLTDTLASLKDRMAVYVDALKAQGVDISSFTL